MCRSLSDDSRHMNKRLPCFQTGEMQHQLLDCDIQETNTYRPNHLQKIIISSVLVSQIYNVPLSLHLISLLNLLFLFFLLRQTLQKNLRFHHFKSDGVKFDRIALQVNLHWLIESDFRFDVTLSRWWLWHHFMQKSAASYEYTRGICLAHTQQCLPLPVPDP